MNGALPFARPPQTRCISRCPRPPAAREHRSRWTRKPTRAPPHLVAVRRPEQPPPRLSLERDGYRHFLRPLGAAAGKSARAFRNRRTQAVLACSGTRRSASVLLASQSDHSPPRPQARPFRKARCGDGRIAFPQERRAGRSPACDSARAGSGMAATTGFENWVHVSAGRCPRGRIRSAPHSSPRSGAAYVFFNIGLRWNSDCSRSCRVRGGGGVRVRLVKSLRLRPDAYAPRMKIILG